MASGAVAVKLTIPKRNEHIKERNILYKKYEELGTQIGKLTTRRGALETQITDINLDNAMDVLNQLENNVQTFNTACQDAQTAIDANNEALRELLASITTEKAHAKATKAAADAAAQTAAEEAAALQKENDSLQAYIASLETQLQGIKDIKLDEINGQIQTSTTTINQYEPALDDSVSRAGEAISQATRDLIAAFKKDTGKEVATKNQEFNALNKEFVDAKEAIVTGLNAKIQALQSVANDANVTATQINAALEADKKNPIDDTSLGDIKGRAAALAAEFGTKATEFANRKVEIEGKIGEDKALAEIRKEIEGLEDTDEGKIKRRPQKPGSTYSTIDIDNSPINAVIKSELNKASEKTNSSILDPIITRINNYIKQFNDKINKVQGELNELNKSEELTKCQDRLNALNEAKRAYEKLINNENDRLIILKSKEAEAKATAAQSRSASPSQQNEVSDADAESSVSEEKRKPGRKYSIFIPTPFIPTPIQQKKPTSRTEAAAATNPEEDAIDPNVLEIFVYEDENDKKSGGASMGAKGEGFIQRGGEPPKVAKIIKVKKITPEIQKLFLSFESPSKTLTSDFLDKIEKNTQSREVVDAPKEIDAEMKEIEKKKEEFIQSDDTSDFFESLGKKVDHKSTIMKLMKWMTTELGKSENKYETLYGDLWRFMYYADCVIILRGVISDYERKMDSGVIKQGVIKQTETQTRNDKEKKGLQQILGWTARSTNTLYDNLLMEISKCEEQVNVNGKLELRDTGKYSKFIHKRFEGRGYRFMLNWLILIALHVYNAESDTTEKSTLLERCGEFIEKLHNVFIQWMLVLKKSNQSSLDEMFESTNPKIVYTEKVTELINKDIFGDSTVKQFINKMRKYMCGMVKSGQRQIIHLSSSKTQKAESPDFKKLLLQRGNAKLRTDDELRTDETNAKDLHDTLIAKFTPKDKDKSGQRQTIQPSSSTKQNAEGNFLDTLLKRRNDLLVTDQTSAEKLHNTLFDRNKAKSIQGGHKRTRKHRTPASSTPAPATRRHRDQSSSAHKRTRRRRSH